MDFYLPLPVEVAFLSFFRSAERRGGGERQDVQESAPHAFGVMSCTSCCKDFGLFIVS